MPVWNTERHNAAKDALRAELDGGKWISHAQAIGVMQSESGMIRTTCANILRELVKDWRLQQRGRYKPGGRYASDTREYRATSPESIDRGKDLAAGYDREIRSLRNKLENQNAIIRKAAAKCVALNEEIIELEKWRDLMLNPPEES